MKGGGSSGYTPQAAQATEIEPLKSAESAMTEAKNETSRAQRLRRAVAGTFSRSSMSGYTSSASTTAGASTKLGS